MMTVKADRLLVLYRHKQASTVALMEGKEDQFDKNEVNFCPN
jgi:hypothetical protein